MPQVLKLMMGVVLVVGAVSAEEPDLKRPLVTVYGTADLKVTPDVVDVSIGIETRSKDLATAIDEQAGRITEALGLIRKAGVEAKAIQTDLSNITPVYSESKNGRNLDYYIVRKGLAFTLKDTAKFDGLIVGLAQVGINRVQNVRFQSTELRKYRDRARELAVVAAREKATALAGKLDQRIGKAFSIDEDEPQIVAPASLLSNRTSEADQGEPESAESSLMPGQISVQARVKVRFELL